MSQLNLTPEEDQIVADALRAKAAQYTAMFGINDPELDALLDKIVGQLRVVESAPAVTEVVEPEVVVEAPAAVVEAPAVEVVEEDKPEQE